MLCRPTLGTRTSSILCGILSWHRIGSRISGDKGRCNVLQQSGPILAIAAIVFGLLRIVMGFSIATIEPADVKEAARARYLGSSTTGQAIDRGIYTILFAVALGTLAEISFQIKRVHEKL